MRRRRLDEMLAAAGLGAPAARRRINAHAQAAPTHARAARQRLAADGRDVPVLGEIEALVTQRVQWLVDASD